MKKLLLFLSKICICSVFFIADASFTISTTLAVSAQSQQAQRSSLPTVKWGRQVVTAYTAASILIEMGVLFEKKVTEGTAYYIPIVRLLPKGYHYYVTHYYGPAYCTKITIYTDQKTYTTTIDSLQFHCGVDWRKFIATGEIGLKILGCRLAPDEEIYRIKVEGREGDMSIWNGRPLGSLLSGKETWRFS